MIDTDRLLWGNSSMFGPVASMRNRKTLPKSADGLDEVWVPKAV